MKQELPFQIVVMILLSAFVWFATCFSLCEKRTNFSHFRYHDVFSFSHLKIINFHKLNKIKFFFYFKKIWFSLFYLFSIFLIYTIYLVNFEDLMKKNLNFFYENFVQFFSNKILNKINKFSISIFQNNMLLNGCKISIRKVQSKMPLNFII